MSSLSAPIQPLTIDRLLTHMTPAEQGTIAVIIDDAEGIGDDWAFEQIRGDLHNAADLNLDWPAADSLAYAIVHECGRR